MRTVGRLSENDSGMNRFNDNLISRIALVRGLASKEDLDAYAQDPEVRAGKKELSELLLERGVIKKSHVDLLRSVLRQKMRKVPQQGVEPDEGDRALGSRALERGVLDPAGLERALLEQEKLRRLGFVFRLGDVLVSRGFVDREGLQSLLAVSGQRILECSSCDAFFQVSGEEAGERCELGTATCPRCSGGLQEPDFFDAVRVDGVIKEGQSP